MDTNLIKNLFSNKYWIAGLIWLEIIVLSELQTNCNISLLPGLLTTIGVLICFVKTRKNITRRVIVPNVTLYALFITLVAYVIHRSPMVYQLIPIDYKIADMLPVMEIMADRLINNESVYAIIPELWGGTQPIYLPAMWLPLVPARFAEVDVRWVGTIGMIGTLVLTLFFRRNKLSLSSFIILFIPLAFFLIWHYRFQLNIVTMTNEGMVFFYYTLLCFAISRNYPMLIGLCLSACLLSRYMIAPWAVMIFIAYCIQENRNFNIKLFVAGSTSTIVLLTIGNAWDRIPRFIGLSGHYLDALMNSQDKYQPLINESLSLMRYFQYSAIPDIHQALTIMSIVTPVLCFVYYWQRRDTIDFRLFALSSMKLSLVVFFAFLTMPYHYIYYTSFIVTIGLGSYVLNSD